MLKSVTTIFSFPQCLKGKMVLCCFKLVYFKWSILNKEGVIFIDYINIDQSACVGSLSVCLSAAYSSDSPDWILMTPNVFPSQYRLLFGANENKAVNDFCGCSLILLVCYCSQLSEVSAMTTTWTFQRFMPASASGTACSWYWEASSTSAWSWSSSKGLPQNIPIFNSSLSKSH